MILREKLTKRQRPWKKWNTSTINFLRRRRSLRKRNCKKLKIWLSSRPPSRSKTRKRPPQMPRNKKRRRLKRKSMRKSKDSLSLRRSELKLRPKQESNMSLMRNTKTKKLRKNRKLNLKKKNKRSLLIQKPRSKHKFRKTMRWDLSRKRSRKRRLTNRPLLLLHPSLNRKSLPMITKKSANSSSNNRKSKPNSRFASRNKKGSWSNKESRHKRKPNRLSARNSLLLQKLSWRPSSLSSAKRKSAKKHKRRLRRRWSSALRPREELRKRLLEKPKRRKSTNYS